VKLWKTRVPTVHCSPPAVYWLKATESSPPSSHMSEAPSTLEERVGCAPFHSTYYYFRTDIKSRRSRGWAR